MKLFATVLATLLILLFSAPVFAHDPGHHGYGYQPQYRHVDRYGVPYYRYPSYGGCGGCGGYPAPYGGNSVGGSVGYYNGQVSGSIYFNQHRHYNGCGHQGYGGHSHRSQSYGGSINSYGGQTGGTLYYNQSQSN